MSLKLPLRILALFSVTTCILLSVTSCHQQPTASPTLNEVAKPVDAVNTNDAVEAIDTSSHPFPRLGMWWLDPYVASIQDMAKYDLLLDSFDDNYLQGRLKEIQLINPSQINLKPLSPTERQLFLHDWEENIDFPNSEVTHLPSDFFLLQTGTSLTRDIQLSDTKIFVDDMFDRDGQPLFHLGGEVVLGQYETAKIVTLLWEEEALIVERGYVREASSHKKGEKVASHIRFWPGSWVMNVTDQCPRIKVHGVADPVNYIEYYFALITGQTQNIYKNPWDNYDQLTNIELYDGIVIDRFEDKESWLKWVNDDQEIYLDLYQDNSYVSASTFDTSWENGTTHLFELLHEAYPGVTIIRNNPLTLRDTPFHGQVYESFGWSNPTSDWWNQLVIAHDPTEYYSSFAYLEWWNASLPDPLILFEVYEDEGSPDENDDLSYDNPFMQKDFEPNYQRMRFSLTSALLGNGYYSYEINTNGHGSLGLMWFDEYDNVGEGKGYLGYPLGDAKALISGVYQRSFQQGLVLVNPTDSAITVTLDKPYRKIKGIQVPEINSGDVVSEVTLGSFDGLILLSNDN